MRLANFCLQLWVVIILKSLLCTTHEYNSLAYVSTCLLNNENIPCSAAQWTDGGGPSHNIQRGKLRILPISVSCGDKQITSALESGTESFSALIAITSRGGCSFAEKALVIQRLGFSALVIIDSKKDTIIRINTKEMINHELEEVEEEEIPLPPGLGLESKQVKILVVMIGYQRWYQFLLSSKSNYNINCFQNESQLTKISNRIDIDEKEKEDKNCKESSKWFQNNVKFEIQYMKPNEANLWSTSPWYKNISNLSLTSTSNGLTYTLRCQINDMILISDDQWLHSQWINELNHRSKNQDDNQLSVIDNNNNNNNNKEKIHQKEVHDKEQRSNCHEIRYLNLSLNLTKPLSLSDVKFGLQNLETASFNSMGPIMHDVYEEEEEEEEGGRMFLFRLPFWDSASESMEDVMLIDGLAKQSPTRSILKDGVKQKLEKLEDEEDRIQLLKGLNSNSHSFPWGGKNKYPRLFESGVILLRNGCVRKDGIIVKHSLHHHHHHHHHHSTEDKVRASTFEKHEYKQHSEETIKFGERNIGEHNHGEHTGEPGELNNKTWADHEEEFEVHYGGCGCCPLGHGELGLPFSSDGETPQIYPKLIILVQRYHHGIFKLVL